MLPSVQDIGVYFCSCYAARILLIVAFLLCLDRALFSQNYTILKMFVFQFVLNPQKLVLTWFKSISGLCGSAPELSQPPFPVFENFVFSLLVERGCVSHLVSFWKLDLQSFREIIRERLKCQTPPKTPSPPNVIFLILCFCLFQDVKRWFQLQRDSPYTDPPMFLHFLWNALQILLVEKLPRYVDIKAFYTEPFKAKCR